MSSAMVCRPLWCLVLACGLACESPEPELDPDLQEFFASTEPTPGPDYDFTQDFFTHNIPVWEEVLAPFRGQPDLHYLEIGVFEGRSALWMLDHVLTHPSARLTAVDPFPTEQVLAIWLSNLEKSGRAQQATTIKGYSQIELRKLPLESFDIVYVDGSHTAADVLSDAILSWGLLEPGGLLIFDDYRWPGYRPGDATRRRRPLPSELRPKLAVDAFMAAFRNQVEIVHLGYQVVLRKVESPCREKYQCSPIGSYRYSWWDQELRSPDGETVRLSPEERDLIERLAHARGFGQSQFRLPRDLREEPGFQGLVERLGLEIVEPEGRR